MDWSLAYSADPISFAILLSIYSKEVRHAPEIQRSVATAYTTL